MHTLTNKTGGWEHYKHQTGDDNNFVNCVGKDDCSYTTEDVDKLTKNRTKIQFSSFGKVKIKNSYNDKELDKLLENKYKKNSYEFDEAINNRILEIQREEFEKELEEVLVLKNTKGKSAAIFNNLKKICGSKKSGQEQVFMIETIRKMCKDKYKFIVNAGEAFKDCVY